MTETGASSGMPHTITREAFRQLPEGPPDFEFEYGVLIPIPSLDVTCVPARRKPGRLSGLNSSQVLSWIYKACSQNRGRYERILASPKWQKEQTMTEPVT